MLQPENKRDLAPSKNSVPNEASQRTVFFGDVGKEQCPKTDMAESIESIDDFSVGLLHAMDHLKIVKGVANIRFKC